MSERSRRSQNSGGGGGLTERHPWPGKGAANLRKRRDRDELMPWPGKRTRVVALRRPPVDPALDPLLDPSPVEDGPVELAEPDRDGHDAVEPAPPAAEADPDRE